MQRDILNCDYMIKYAKDGEEITQLFFTSEEAREFIRKNHLNHYEYWSFSDLPF